MSPELIAVCKKLVKDGKTISVGMIKSRAPQNTPLPQIIQAVQFCKNQAETLMQMETPTDSKLPEQRSVPESTIVTQLMTKITELELRIEKLEAAQSKTEKWKTALSKT